MKKVAVLGIDIQNDFTLPTGALFVKGADADVKRMADFVLSNQEKISYIALTLDSHQPIHIAHQCYWKGETGSRPALFSTISASDVRKGVWIPQFNRERALPYLEQLEAKGEVCTIWPMHCVLGTEGWAINKVLTDSLTEWAVDNGYTYELFYKGYSQWTEHYSIFKAAVEWEGEPGTLLNTRLLSVLNDFDEVLLMGEAADYCVANSLSDILDECSELAEKTVILTDCMSWINPDNERAKAIFEKARQQKARFLLSTEYTF
jgi:nicotinamidase-related amidase